MREPDGAKKTALEILGGLHYLEGYPATLKECQEPIKVLILGLCSWSFKLLVWKMVPHSYLEGRKGGRVTVWTATQRRNYHNHLIFDVIHYYGIVIKEYSDFNLQLYFSCIYNFLCNNSYLINPQHACVKGYSSQLCLSVCACICYIYSRTSTDMKAAIPVSTMYRHLILLSVDIIVIA